MSWMRSVWLACLCALLAGVATSGSAGAAPSPIPTVCPHIIAPPTGVTAAPGSTSAAVTWTAPLVGCNGPASAYAVYAYPQVSPKPVRIATATAYTFDGLQSDTYYTFTVTALEGDVWSAWSAWSPWVKTLPATAPCPQICGLSESNASSTLAVPAGEGINVGLSGAMTWTSSSSDSMVVVRINQGTLSPPPGPPGGPLHGAYFATYIAAHPGTATITAIGQPVCTPGQPCPVVVQELQWTLVVGPEPGPGGKPTACAGLGGYPCGLGIVNSTQTFSAAAGFDVLLDMNGFGGSEVTPYGLVAASSDSGVLPLLSQQSQGPGFESFRALFLPLRPGMATVTLTATPTCAAPPCGLPIVTLHWYVKVLGPGVGNVPGGNCDNISCDLNGGDAGLTLTVNVTQGQDALVDLPEAAPLRWSSSSSDPVHLRLGSEMHTPHQDYAGADLYEAAFIVSGPGTITARLDNTACVGPACPPVLTLTWTIAITH